MRTVLIFTACVLVISACLGCEAFKLRKDYSKVQEVKVDKGPIAVYIEDRFLDFMDILGIKVTMGTGLLAHGRATKFAQAGIGFFDGDKFGFKGREVGYWQEWRGEVGVSVFYINTAKKNILIGNKFLFDAARAAEVAEVGDIDIFRDDDRDRWSAGAAVHVLFFGIDIDIRLKEIADFIFGIFFLDMMKDDTKNRLRRAHITAEQRKGFSRTVSPEAITSPPHIPRAAGSY